jgi:hypothetical protein
LIDRVSIIGLFPVIIVRLILLEGVDTIDLPTPHKKTDGLATRIPYERLSLFSPSLFDLP